MCEWVKFDIRYHIISSNFLRSMTYEIYGYTYFGDLDQISE